MLGGESIYANVAVYILYIQGDNNDDQISIFFSKSEIKSNKSEE